jgi:hypothetical protein
VLTEHGSSKAVGASFVSVTQQFNTTTSMGRLTLNMLLSFAQFEREIAGERIRDKIAASKAKGVWMGGNVPLGYDVRERKLVVSEAEASTVRMIFQRYAELGTVALLKAGIDAMASRLGVRRDYVAVLGRLSYLSPEIVRAILVGRQPIELTPTRLAMLSRNLPHDWQQQRRLLGFAPA